MRNCFLQPWRNRRQRRRVGLQLESAPCGVAVVRASKVLGDFGGRPDWQDALGARAEGAALLLVAFSALVVLTQSATGITRAASTLWRPVGASAGSSAGSANTNHETPSVSPARGPEQCPLVEAPDASTTPPYPSRPTGRPG